MKTAAFTASGVKVAEADPVRCTGTGRGRCTGRGRGPGVPLPPGTYGAALALLFREFREVPSLIVSYEV